MRAEKACMQRFRLRLTEAKNAGCDYVILVGHLGEEGTTERWTSDQVIAHTSGIDA